MRAFDNPPKGYTVGASCASPERDASGNPPTRSAEEPRSSAERLSYLHAGAAASRETAQFAVVRDFDDRGNVISLMTERLTH